MNSTNQDIQQNFGPDKIVSVFMQTLLANSYRDAQHMRNAVADARAEIVTLYDHVIDDSLRGVFMPTHLPRLHRIWHAAVADCIRAGSCADAAGNLRDVRISFQMSDATARFGALVRDAYGKDRLPLLHDRQA